MPNTDHDTPMNVFCQLILYRHRETFILALKYFVNYRFQSAISVWDPGQNFNAGSRVREDKPHWKGTNKSLELFLLVLNIKVCFMDS